ncbi:hypothetical protein E2C01_040885 [Portunus trituberculatus]|uniref:Uncharacterized protein n=1 Tax=Portunus trituberculatus TaxID=210409 RepID=A0A5B7FPF3_PORTR|nr:hypothetical protein [Portunus trituberculatus]
MSSAPRPLKVLPALSLRCLHESLAP